MARNEDGALYDSTRTIVVTANRECRATAYAAVVEFRGSSTAARTCETMMVVFRALSAARDVRVRALFGREQTIASFEPGIDGRF